MTNDKLAWVLPVPFLIFGAGAWLYFQTENEVAVQMKRAQAHWRDGDYLRAVEVYRKVYSQHPRSRFADQAIWEVGNIFYVNLYHIDEALAHFNLLVRRYPETPLAQQSYLKLAEIHERELGDLAQALEYLGRILAMSPSRTLRRHVFFKMAELHFKMSQFEQARRKFEMVIEGESRDHLAHQARIRLGTIHQITHHHEQALPYFREASRYEDCSECRVEGYLGLIESYEFLGELGKATEVAKSIPTPDYPQEMKAELLERLGTKSKYYQPPGRRR